MPESVDPERKPPASIADAEAAAAEAQARAEAARTRAIELRKQAEKASAAGTLVEGRKAHLRWSRPRWLRLPRRKSVAVGAAIVLACALLGASGYMAWHHRGVVRDRERGAEFAAAARQGAVNLMSINFNSAAQDVQRVIDDSTGQFNRMYEGNSPALIKAMQDSKVVTKATVNAVAIESMTPNSAAVLVVASTERHNAKDATDRPATWRMTITLDWVDGRPKMSNVEIMR